MIECDAADDLWIHRIVETDDYHLAIGCDVSICSSDRDVVRAGQRPVRIERAVWISAGVKLALSNNCSKDRRRAASGR